MQTNLSGLLAYARTEDVKEKFGGIADTAPNRFLGHIQAIETFKPGCAN